MEKSFNELRERLLLAGVAPRHMRRYLNELSDHLADLTAEEERAGRSRADAKSAAQLRLGTMDDLAKALIEQRHFQSWCTRAPWAVFGFAPLALLAAAWFVACFILWSGWKAFLPGTETPFIRVDGFAVLYFGVGRMLYFFAPIVIGWTIGIAAARQRLRGLRALWPSIGFLLVALVGGILQVQTSRPAVPGAAGQVSMGLAPGPFLLALSSGLGHATVLLSLMVLPYLVWRLKKALTRSTS